MISAGGVGVKNVGEYFHMTDGILSISVLINPLYTAKLQIRYLFFDYNLPIQSDLFFFVHLSLNGNIQKKNSKDMDYVGVYFFSSQINFIAS